MISSKYLNTRNNLEFSRRFGGRNNRRRRVRKLLIIAGGAATGLMGGALLGGQLGSIKGAFDSAPILKNAKQRIEKLDELVDRGAIRAKKASVQKRLIKNQSRNEVNQLISRRLVQGAALGGGIGVVYGGASKARRYSKRKRRNRSFRLKV